MAHLSTVLKLTLKNETFEYFLEIKVNQFSFLGSLSGSGSELHVAIGRRSEDDRKRRRRRPWVRRTLLRSFWQNRNAEGEKIREFDFCLANSLNCFILYLLQKMLKKLLLVICDSILG